MWAQVVHQWGQEVVCEQVPDPVPNRDEVLIQVEACGVGVDPFTDRLFN